MSQKQNSNTYVVCSPKGGVGKTILSEILTTLIYTENKAITVYRPDDFNVIDNEPHNFKLVHIGTKSIQLQNFGKRINTDCIDFLFRKSKNINIIDLSKDGFELLQELGMGVNYYIPLTDNAIEVTNVLGFQVLYVLHSNKKYLNHFLQMFVMRCMKHHSLLTFQSVR